MRFRDRLAVNIAPIFIRLALAVTFLWAGVGKIAGTFEPTDAQRAILQNQGMIAAPASSPPASPAPPPGEATKEATPRNENATQPEEDAQQPGEAAPNQPATTSAAPKTVRKWNGIALLLHDRANPGLDENGNPHMRLWPTPLAGKPWVGLMVFLLVATEVVGGVCALFGFLTRLTGLAFALAMGSALWLTEIGPYIQEGTAVFGFLPPHDPWDPAAWKTLFWQFLLGMSGLSLVFSGAGSLSIDRALWGPSRAASAKASRDEDDDDDE